MGKGEGERKSPDFLVIDDSVIPSLFKSIINTLKTSLSVAMTVLSGLISVYIISAEDWYLKTKVRNTKDNANTGKYFSKFITSNLLKKNIIIEFII
jgi:hypothetical protein